MAEYFVKVPDLRKRFREKYRDKIAQGLYDAEDLARLEDNDTYVELFLQSEKGNIDSATSMIDGAFVWRKSIGVNGLSSTSFPREVHEKGAIYFHNHDKDGNEILYFRIKDHKKDPTKLLLLQKYVAYLLEQYFMENMGSQIVVMFDMTDAGLSNMDLDLIKFIITCFTTYYPNYLAYLLVYDMPWVLNAVWKIIKTWLSEESSKKVIFVKKGDIQEYIDKDQLLEHMGGTDTYKYTYIPPSLDIGDSSGEMMSLTHENGILPSPGDLAARKKVTFAGREQNMYASFSTDTDDVDASPTTPTKPDGSVKNRPQSLLTHRKDRGESTYDGKYLSVSPANQLDFEVTDLKKESLDILTLTNNHQENRVAFKVKTTSPEKYRVRPSTGVVRSGSSTEVSVYLQPGITNVARDKFLVMAMDIGTDGFSSSGELADKWRSEPRDNIMEHRLRTNVTEKLKSPVEEGLPESSLSPVTTTQDSPSLEKKIDDMNRKLENILRLHRNQELRLDRIYRYQVFFCLCIVFISIAIALSYKLDYLPIQKYTVNACMPHFMH
ncbi:motile sperm domain-containing protein 2-like [Lineus longissimus]|uniref:motile sperm domain-containing protein 2-like n=1 Tax=Lineus longissimus TaxID=88925 RepID=UPI002B4D342B